MRMKLAAVDLGGTTVKGARLEDSQITARANAPTNAVSRESITESLFSVLAELMPFDGVALASAGTIDPYRGVCVYATENLPGFTGYDLRTAVSERFGVSVRVINDAHAALLGEARHRGLHRPAAMLTLGTGVGGAYYDGSRVVFGQDFAYGRYGHLTLVRDGAPCSCGKKGCIEAYVSGTALQKTAATLGLTPAELFTARQPNAQAAVRNYLDLLVRAMRRVREADSFETMILFGGVMNSADSFISYVREQCPFRVETSLFGGDAGILGAAEWFKEGI